MNSDQRPLRVVIAKPGLDGHDVGAKLVGRALADAGMQVVYTGLRKAPAAIVDKAIEHEADVVGLSILSGTHLRLTRDVLAVLKEKDLSHVTVIVGGNVPACDHAELRAMGVAEVFPTSTPFNRIVDFLTAQAGSNAQKGSNAPTGRCGDE